jgi:hypothetical protein
MVTTLPALTVPIYLLTSTTILHCCGSGSWSILCLLDSEPSLFCTDPDASIHQQAKKKLRKTLISTIFDFFFDFVSMKSDVNVSSKSKKKKNVHFGHLVSILSAIDEKQDPNPIRKLMVRVRGSGSAPNCHGSTTLLFSMLFTVLRIRSLVDFIILPDPTDGDILGITKETGPSYCS